jgi:hypothetical protein
MNLKMTATPRTFQQFMTVYKKDLVSRCNGHLQGCAKRYDYKTFGYDFQDFIEKDMCAFAGKYANPPVNIKGSFQSKNTFPDIELTCSKWGLKTRYAVDLKCTNTACTPTNDLGAMDGIHDKVAPFSQTHFIFIGYSIDTASECLLVSDVYSRPFYEFVGRSKDGLIAYREKDGMMRPAPLIHTPWIKNRKQFDGLLKKTLLKRQRAIITKTLQKMPTELAHALLLELLAQRSHA